jgi:hypothetical protein
VKRTLFQRALIGIICLGVALDCAPARADSLKTMGDEIIFGGVAVAAAIGVGVFFAFHHGRSIQGCAVDGPDGLEIRTKNGADAYHLSGATAGVKVGNRVRLTGKKKSAKDSDVPNFVVRGVAKDFGPCAAAVGP